MKRKRKKYSRSTLSRKSNLDTPLLFITILLTLFGILMVYDASVIEAYRNFSDKFYFAKQQVLWAAIGITAMISISFVPYKLLKKIGVWLFFISLGLLVLVLFPSFSTKALGARRWINFGGFTIQPAEFTKLTMTIYLASYLERKKKLAPFLFIVAIIVGLIMLEPDLGTAVVIAGIAFSIYFISGAPISALILISLAGVLSGFAFIASSPYRRARVATFLNPTQDPLGASYHIRQILIALGSGGLFGVGLGKSRQKYEYIPAATTDSIFAIVAEESGFLGSALLIGLFIFIIIRAFRIAKNAPDEFSRLLASGIACWIGIQTLLNLSTMVALVPLTGAPLPFISYGGSATISALMGVGILLGISKYSLTKSK